MAGAGSGFLPAGVVGGFQDLVGSGAADNVPDQGIQFGTLGIVRRGEEADAVIPHHLFLVSCLLRLPPLVHPFLPFLYILSLCIINLYF